MVVVAVAFDRLGDPLDPAESGVPGGADRGQLGDGPGELRVVDLVVTLAAGRRGVNQADPAQDGQVLGDGLAGDGQPPAQ